MNVCENRGEINSNDNNRKIPTYQKFQNNNENTPTMTSCSQKCGEILNPKIALPNTTTVRNDNDLNLQSGDLSDTSNILLKNKNKDKSERNFQYRSDLFDTTDKHCIHKLIGDVGCFDFKTEFFCNFGSNSGWECVKGVRLKFASIHSSSLSTLWNRLVTEV